MKTQKQSAPAFTDSFVKRNLLFLIGFLLFVLAVGGFLAYAGENLEQYESTFNQANADYSEWTVEKQALENHILRQESRSRRDVFNAHCLLIEKKQEVGEILQDARYLTSCQTGNIELYFQIRLAGF